MKIFRSWPAIGMVAATLALVGCGGSGSGSSNASLRVANATLTHPSLDLLVNSGVASTAVTSDTVGAYASPSSGSVTLQVNDAGGATSLATVVPTLTGGNHYTLLAYESGGAVRTAVLNEDFATPTSGTAQLRIYDAALDAGKVDVYVTAPGVDLGTVSSPTATFTTTTANSASALFTYSPGTYEIRVTAAGNKADLRGDVTAVLANQQVATIALTPASGGALVNGSVLIQQAGYTASRNTNSRVRLASAVSGGATVGATASNGTVIDAGSVAPAFSFGYVLVPAASSLNITVNGASIGAPAGTLAAGADSTLLVYGAPGAATAALIADDNRLPSDATTVKLRMINGLTGTTGPLTLTANTAPVGQNIAFGAASSYVTIPSSANATILKVTSSTGTLYQPDTSNVLSANTVYTVFIGGPSTAAMPQLLIR